jgi:outer membrane protein OmpA-like peptidoglycan-associated protein
MKYGIATVLLVVVGLAGCATPRTSFYLVPDPSGHVGEVTVSSEAGTATLTKANETVAANHKDKTLTAAREATSEEIQTKFGDALAIVPPPPEGFSVYFDTDSSNVKAGSEPVFDQALAEVRARDSRDVSINGHTDRTGDAAHNMQLSLDRANKVKDLLVKQGVPQEHLSIEYYGESKPVVPTADNVPEPKNRRVEVVVR